MFRVIRKIGNVRALQLFQIMRFAVLMLIRVVLAKMGILTDEIGKFEYFFFLVNALSFFWLSGILQALLPLDRNSNTFGKSTGKSQELYNAFLLLSAFTVLAVVLLFGYEISGMGPRTPNLMFLAIFLLFSIPSYLIEYIYLLNNRALRILQYGAIVFFLQLTFVVIPLILGWPMQYVYGGLVLFAVIKFIWLLVLLKIYALRTFSFTYIKEHLNLGTPLILSAFFGGSAQYIDGFIIKQRFDDTSFAIFQYGAKELPFVYMFANVLSNAMVARFGQDSNLQNVLTMLRSESTKLMHALFPLSIVLLLGSSYFYPLLFSYEFTESAKIFNIYLLLIISRLVFPQAILIGLKHAKVILRMSAAELVINVTLSLLFINWWGIIGVAYATVVAYFVDKLYLAIVVWKSLHIKPSAYIKLRLLLVYGLALMAAYYATTFL